jgi:cellulose synthase/poly-beta-1,6-N-acetylglucosamine synthase-like glycosyltransferase
VFIRSELLRSVGGYDPGCLAEDCELGVRLSTLGVPIVVAYDPYLVTREETPHSLRDLVRQRTRWNQGFLQAMRKGVWRHLPRRRQRLLARYTLAQPFLQAFTGPAVPLAVATALWLKAPVPIALLTFLPAVPTLAMIAFQVVGLREFCRTYYVRPKALDYLRLVIGAVPYQMLLAFAACRAVWRQAHGQGGWEKTSHRGAHRPTPRGV